LAAVPFKNDEKLKQHFEDHGADFGVATDIEYLGLAELFLNGPLPDNTLECIRPQGGRCRYNEVTQEYGTVTADGFIATYMKPDVKVHGMASNLIYFRLKCL
jgi:pyocin large subunit-like protein